MVERRSLVEGLKSTPQVAPEVEKAFVMGTKPRQPEPKPPAAPQVARAPISTRIRSDFAQALKRASLERQLNGVEPSTLQDILEEAVEPWLRTHGYLS